MSGVVNMEQINKRYIEIDTCMKCGHNGHITSSSKDNIVFICSNPAHRDLEVPKELIGKIAYPIVAIEQKNTGHACSIPSWCTLPKGVNISK